MYKITAYDKIYQYHDYHYEMSRVVVNIECDNLFAITSCAILTKSSHMFYSNNKYCVPERIQDGRAGSMHCGYKSKHIDFETTLSFNTTRYFTDDNYCEYVKTAKEKCVYSACTELFNRTLENDDNPVIIIREATREYKFYGIHKFLQCLIFNNVTVW